MIKIKKQDLEKPIITEIDLLGQKLRIELLPLSDREYLKRLQKFRKTKHIPNPISKAMELVPYFDDSDPKFLTEIDDLLDEHIKNFWGVASEDGVELDGTVRENKLLLGSIQLDDEEVIEFTSADNQKGSFTQKRSRYFRVIILDKMKELAKTQMEIEEKNSGSSPDPLPGESE